METVATSVRVAGDAIGILAKLSEKLGQSKAQVIEIALKELEERLFWQEVHESFDRLAADPAEVRKQQAEADAWERGTSRDLVGEDW